MTHGPYIQIDEVGVERPAAAEPHGLKAGARRESEPAIRRGRPKIARAALTTIELLAATAILTIAVVSSTMIFSITSEASGRTAAQADLLATASAVQRELSSDLDSIIPGMLIIECPRPTLAKAETPGGPAYFRLRHDRLVFLTRPAIGSYQSTTDPRRGSPAALGVQPTSSGEALVYWGPGLPLDGAGLPRSLDDPTLPAKSWILQRRRILLALDAPPIANWTPADMATVFNPSGGILDGGSLLSAYEEGAMDVIVSATNLRAEAQSIIDGFSTLNTSAYLSSSPSVAALWQPSWAIPIATIANPASAHHYTKTGFNFCEGLADLRIEWTDGQLVDSTGTTPGELSLRWFGLKLDTAQASDPATPDALRHFADMRHDHPGAVIPPATTPVDAADNELFLKRIEWSATGATPDVNAAYRAVWRTDTWALRPTALKVTFRLFDRGDRLRFDEVVDLDRDGIGDPETPAQKVTVAPRYGEEYSFVLPVP